jgi:biopolymer transport protein ExbD
MAMSGGNGISKAASEINVTPLIDVLLVLLIIFMVIVPATPKGLETLLPQTPKSPQTETSRAIVVSVLGSQSGPTTYLLNQDRVSQPELEAKLQQVYALRSDKVMFVKGDSALNYSAVADVINMGTAAGVTSVGIITPKVEQGD